MTDQRRLRVAVRFWSSSPHRAGALPALAAPSTGSRPARIADDPAGGRPDGPGTVADAGCRPLCPRPWTRSPSPDCHRCPQRIFDERLLVIDIDQNPDLDTLFQQFPVVNQQLRR